MELEIQNNRKLLAKKDDTIKQQECKIEQLTRSINELQEQKKDMIKKQKGLEEDLIRSKQQLNPKGSKNQ